MNGETVSTAVLGLGANLGDPVGQIRVAIEALSRGLAELRVSSAYRSRPEGGARQPDFVNAVALGIWPGSPGDLLAMTRELEARAGRTRPYPGSPRTLDIDIVFLGTLELDEPGLTVPHPRWASRPFVVVPLLELAPDWVDPVTGLSVSGVARANGWTPDTLEKVADARSMAPRERT